MTQRRRRNSSRSAASHLRTLGIDIGGTAVKAAILDATGKMVTERCRVSTPHPCPPSAMLMLIDRLASTLAEFDRISIGFPGVVRAGRVITAPNLGTSPWRGYRLATAVSRRLGKPTRLLNDAEVQGLGIIDGRGLEVVLTLGTGVGSAVFTEGQLAPHLELGQHPLHNGHTYDQYIGNEAFLAKGHRKWNHRVRKAIEVVETLFNYDKLHLGGGNATHIDFDLPEGVSIAPNDTGITGGIHLWDARVWRAISKTHDIRLL